MGSVVRLRRAATFVDLLVIGVVLAFIGGVSVLMASDAREDANRTTCAEHLRRIGQAVLLYANENRGAPPRTRSVIESADHPVAYTHPTAQLTADEVKQNVSLSFCKAGPEPNDVTAGLFLLLVTQDITPDVFLCPSVKSSTTRRTDPLDPKAQCNFSGPAQLNYSYLNPYPSERAVGRRRILDKASPATALASDMNSGSDALLTLTPESNAEAMRKANSPNHTGDGQNVLYFDGHVEFQTHPFAGEKQDNIFTYRKEPDGIESGGIVGSPFDMTDTVLLPTAAQVPPK